MTKLSERVEGLVSIVITSYNYGHFICDALNGLKSQTYKCIEIIVIDDCSTDGSDEIIKNWYEENKKSINDFLYVKLPRNCGASWAANIGFSLSRGEYIVIHDADDISHSGKIEKQVMLLKTHPDTSMVGTGYWTFNEDIGNLNKAENGSGWLSFSAKSIEKNYKYLGRHCVCYGTLMFRASILEEIIGCYKAIPVGNDMFFIQNAVNHDYVVENLRDNLFYIRHHGGQMNTKIRKNELASVLQRRKKIEGRVSVVLTIENSGFSERALQSIFKQTYKDIELIVIDDSDNGELQAVIEEYWAKVKNNIKKQGINELFYFKLPRYAGYPWNYNIGCYLSKGEYIAFHNARGILKEDKLFKQVEFLNNNFMYSVVGTNYQDSNSRVKYDDNIEYSYAISYEPCIKLETLMLRSDIIDKTAGLSCAIQGGEDFEFIYRLLNNGYKAQNLREILYYE